MMKPLVIIGSGLAGYMLAKEWRKLEKNCPLTIITADDGAFYSKPLLSTALTNSKIPDQLVVADANEMAKQLQATIHRYCQVNSIDPEARIIICQCNGQEKRIEFSQLVIACGATKIKLPLEGDAIDQVYSVNNLEEYRHFRHWLEGKKQIAIIGSGLVGCEFANDLINSGHQVEMIAMEQYPLANLVPEKIGCQLLESFQQQGVHWHLGHLATAVNKTSSSYEISLSNGSKLHADGVFAAIGIRPKTDLAKLAGIETNRGIVVNRLLQTNYPHIFALGDCAEVHGMVKQYVAPILHCARSLAKTLMGDEQPVHYPCMPIVIKTPTCPVVTSPPPAIEGRWHYEGKGANMSALFYDNDGQLRGFALSGNKVRDKTALARQLTSDVD